MTAAPLAGLSGAGAGGPEGGSGVGVGVDPPRADEGCDRSPSARSARTKTRDTARMRDGFTTNLLGVRERIYNDHAITDNAESGLSEPSGAGPTTTQWPSVRGIGGKKNGRALSVLHSVLGMDKVLFSCARDGRPGYSRSWLGLRGSSLFVLLTAAVISNNSRSDSCLKWGGSIGNHCCGQ